MTVTAPDRLRGEALRQQVLDTALRLFSERGYFNTSVHDIRRAAGVSTGAIYHHFGNKEELARALYHDVVARMQAAIEGAIAGRADCRDRCRAIIARLFRLTEEEPRLMQFVLLAQHRQYLPDERPVCSSRPFATMRDVVERGMAAGEVREMAPWVAGTAMFGGALRMMSLHLDGALEGSLSGHLDEVAECGWRAVKA